MERLHCGYIKCNLCFISHVFLSTKCNLLRCALCSYLGMELHMRFQHAAFLPSEAGCYTIYFFLLMQRLWPQDESMSQNL